MKHRDFKRISDILKDITPHSEDLKNFLVYKNYNDEKSKEIINQEKENIVEIIEDNKNIVENPERNLIINSDEAESKMIEEFIKGNDENLDADVENILDRLEEIEKGIKDIKNQDEISEKIKREKDKIEENKLKKEEELKNKDKDKQQEEKKNKEKNENEIKNQQENKAKEEEKLKKEEQNKKNENDKKEILSKEDEKKKLKQEEEKKNKERDEKDKENREREKKEKENIDKENKDKLNIENLGVRIDQDETKKILADLGIKSNHVDKSFTEKVLMNKENIEKAKNTLENNDIKSSEDAKTKISEIDNKIQSIQSIIEGLIAGEESIPSALITELQNLNALKGNINTAMDIISSNGLTK